MRVGSGHPEPQQRQGALTEAGLCGRPVQAFSERVLFLQSLVFSPAPLDACGVLHASKRLGGKRHIPREGYCAIGDGESEDLDSNSDFSPK